MSSAVLEPESAYFFFLLLVRFILTIQILHIVIYYLQMKAKNSKKSAQVQRDLPSSQYQKREYFDQADENMDTLKMKQHQDPQYNALLKTDKSANTRKNNYFFTNQRYHTSQQPPSSEQQQQPQLFTQEKNQDYQISQALKDLKKQRQQKSKLLSEQVHRIQEEDQQFQQIRKQQKTSNEAIQQATCLRNQLDLFKDMVELRYSKQNELDSIKILPANNFVKNNELNLLQKQLQGHLINNLNTMIKAYHSYSQKCLQETTEFTDFRHKYEGQKQKKKNSLLLQVEQMHRSFSQEQKRIVQKGQQELVKWSQKTNLISLNSSRYSSLLMQTPVGQTKKVLENWQRARGKSQHKRSTFKVLFENTEEIRQTTHPQIFDDFQLFHELQKVYVNELEEDNQFRVSDTLTYLKNRPERGNQGKQVDRKASKNRKLRYNIHAKLLNFMPSRSGIEIQARDSIVENMFNCRAGEIHKEKQQSEPTYYIDL